MSAIVTTNICIVVVLRGRGRGGDGEGEGGSPKGEKHRRPKTHDSLKLAGENVSWGMSTMNRPPKHNTSSPFI